MLLIQDGVVLCQLMSGLDQGSIPRIHTGLLLLLLPQSPFTLLSPPHQPTITLVPFHRQGKMLELGFKRRENIMYFIEALRDNKVPRPSPPGGPPPARPPVSEHVLVA
jgi:hypothetical protein